MKKISLLFAFLLALFSTGNVQAARMAEGEQLDATMIKADLKLFLKTLASTNNGNYLNGLTTTSPLSDDNLFQLIDAGITVNGNPTYYLMKVNTSTYVQAVSVATTGTTMGAKETAANFEVLSCKGVTTNTLNDAASSPGGLTESSLMFRYTASNGTVLFLNSNSQGAVCRMVTGKGNWSTWNCYAVGELSPLEAKLADLNDLLTSTKKMSFVVGTEIGCTTAADSTLFSSTLDYAQTAYDNQASIESVTLAFDSLTHVAAYMMNKAIIPLTEGYYRVVNALPGFATSQPLSPYKVWYATASNFLAWTAEDDTNPYQVFYFKKLPSGNWSIQNLATQAYVNYGTGQSAQVTLATTPAYEQVITAFGTNASWNLKSKYNDFMYHAGSHANGAGTVGGVVLWNGDGVSASAWKFKKVDDTAIDGLKAKVVQMQLNAKMATLIGKAQVKYDLALVYDKSETPEITDTLKISSNADQNTLGTSKDGGGFPALLDNNTQTYWHSAYQNAPAADHYLQFDLSAKPLQTFVFGYTRRIQNNNNRPTDIVISATNDTTNTTEKPAVWTTIKEINSGLPTSETVNSYISSGIEMGAPYKYIRFTFLKTNSGGVANGHVFVHFSEFNLFSATLNANSQINRMGEIGTNLKNALATAQGIKDATQSDIDALQTAYDAFVGVLADPANLKAEITTDTAFINKSIVGTTPGCVAQADIDAFQAAVNVATPLVTDIMATKANLDAALATLQAARKAFFGKVITVTPGKWYYIVSTASKAYCLNNAIYSSSNIPKSQLKWNTYSTDETPVDNAHYYWRFVAMGDTAYAIQNLATGYYIGHQDTISNALRLSVEPQPWKISYLGQKAFNIAQYGYDPIHAQEAGKAVVSYTGGLNTASAWGFVEREAEDGHYLHTLPMINNKLYTMCMPFSIQFALDPNNVSTIKMYTISGANRDASNQVTSIKLHKIAEGSVIAAGRPIVFILGDLAKNVDKPTAADSLNIIFGCGANDVTNMEGSENGLIGSFGAKSFGIAGLGYTNGVKFYTNVAPEGGTLPLLTISDNSAYINESLIKETGESTDLTIDVLGTLNGINSATITKAAADANVYSVTGVKVGKKSNVKSLPSGIYIINGEKYSVK